MPAFTTQQWVILFLVFVLGWLLGLLSRSTKKWRRAYETERDARIEEQREQAAALETAQARIVELERERPAAAIAPATTVASPASTLDLRRDDLSLIRGLGPEGEQDLNEEGLYRYGQIIEMTTAEEAELEDRLGADRGYIRQEQWREQAQLLAEGALAEHRARFS
ncbi:hypothetical protein [Sphingomonas sp.]|uniref:hypothetical protein n=1 Tax=Sphingomonas sp. TaxID=28214 RepID=UPI000DAFB88E|nr:hypothetical protein [Sphingomonas sp.]PZU08604.1 MAG: hypothetical protein DI605_11640 [Sphingomonas sp.]